MTYDEKPSSMSMKSFLIRKLSVKLLTEEHVVEAVVHHQFASALKATSQFDEIEISGFGKLLFNRNKAFRKYEKELSKMSVFQKLLSQSPSPARKASLENKLNTTIQTAVALKEKLNTSDEYSAHLRRMEEQYSQVVGCSGTDSSATP